MFVSVKGGIFLIKKGKSKVKVYRGNYGPVNIVKNEKQIAGWTEKSVSGTYARIDDTYAFPAVGLNIKGRSNLSVEKNILPMPASNEAITENASLTSYENGITFSRDNMSGETLLYNFRIKTYSGNSYVFSTNDPNLQMFTANLGYVTSGTVLGSIGRNDDITLVYKNSQNYDGRVLQAQIEIGTVPTEWEKGKTYIGGVGIDYPAQMIPSKAKLVVSGKNLFTTDNKVTDQNVTYTKNSCNGFKIVANNEEKVLSAVIFSAYLKRGKYTVSFLLKSVDVHDGMFMPNRWIIFDKNDKVITSYVAGQTVGTNKHSFSFEVAEEGTCRVNVYVDSRAVIVNNFSAEYSKIQIETGENATEFDPYREPNTIQLPLMRAIDRENMPEYFSMDQITNANVFIKMINEKIFDGTEDFSVSDTATQTICFCLSDAVNQGVNSNLKFCSHFEFSSDHSADKELYSIDENGNAYFRINLSRQITTAEGFKSWLQTQNQNNTPVVLWYSAGSPQVTALPQKIRSIPKCTCFEIVADNGYSTPILNGSIKAVKDD